MTTPTPHIDNFVKENLGWIDQAPTLLRELALANALSHEIHPSGEGFVSHPDDPGGATNWGISLRFLLQFVDKSESDRWTIASFDADFDGDIDAKDVADMDIGQAMEIYRFHYWNQGKIRFLPPRLAVKMFDMSVNLGKSQACKLLQRVLNFMNPENKLKVDGVLGEKTVLSAWEVEASESGIGEVVIDKVRQAQSNFYTELAAQKRQFNTFLKGWLRRAMT